MKILYLYASPYFSFRCFVLTCNKSFYKLLFSYFTVNIPSLIRQEESTMSIPEFTTQLKTCHLVWDFKNCTWIPFCCGLVILVSVYKIRYTSKYIQWNFYKKKKSSPLCMCGQQFMYVSMSINRRLMLTLV